MSAIDLALPRLKVEEGFRPKVYRDTVGKQTIGYGFCIDAGISERAATALLQAQAQERHEALMAYPWYASLDEPRQSVVLDVAFNAGLDGLLHFPKMIAALAHQNWQTAANELLDSDAARKLPGRYGPMAQILRNGA